MERTVCFILDASNWGQGDCCPKTDTLLYSQGEIAFIDRGRGLYAETAESALTVILKLVMCSDQHRPDFKYN